MKNYYVKKLLLNEMLVVIQVEYTNTLLPVKEILQLIFQQLMMY
jgi:hypothetical protein